MKKIQRERKPKPPTEMPLRQYPLLTMDDIKTQEVKYAQRLLELRFCLNFIDDAIKEKELIDDLQLLMDKWHDYVKTVPYPKPYAISDINEFYTRQRHIENSSVEGDVCYSLRPDKRLLLSQDFQAREKAYTTLDAKPRFEDELCKFVDDSLKIIRRIEMYLENERETAQATKKLLTSIREMKTYAANEIMDYFDRFVYRILSAQDIYMKSVDAISCEYSVSCDHCSIHLWGFRNVPIRFNYLEEPRVLVNLYDSKLLLHIPYGMLHLNMTLQAIHMDFDYISEKAKSFKFVTEVGNVNFALKDLRECLLNEFKTQMHIQNIVREMMQERYEIYLNRVQTKTLRKIHLKPQPIQPDEYPDISDDFFEEENQQFQDFLNIAYHPRTLNLYEDEINLKKFSILGGVFKLNFVKKPSQIECNNIHMIWHNPERKLIIEQDETISPLKSHRRSRSFRLSSIKSEIEILKEEIEPENPLFVMIFRLPEHLCYWSEPIACHYEVFEEEEIVEQEKAWNEYHKTVDNFLKSAESVFKEIGDEEFGEIGSLISKASKISIRPSQMKHFFESRVSDQLTLTEQLTFVDSGVYFVKDFSLNDPMDVQQARMLARSCTPYILPSFKFQKEITEELEGEPRSRKRRKSRKLGALRGRVQQQYIKSARLISWDSKQNNPEYMFSNFEKAPRIRVTTMLAPFEDKLPSEPITFYQLIRTLLSIKRLIKDQEHKRVARLAITIPLTPEEGSQNDSQKSGIIGKSIMKDSRSYIKQQQSAFGLTQKSSQYKKKSIAYKMKADVITKDSTSPKGEEKLLEEEGSITMKSENPIKNDEQQITVIRFEDSAEVAGEQEPIATTTEITTTEIPLITNDEKRESITTKEEDLSKGIEEIPKNPPVSGVEGHQKTDSEGDSVSVNTFDDTSSDSMEKQKLRTIKTSHWTTKYIKRFTFNKEENKFIIETDRLGYIGFAFKSYAHFPFKYWELEPNQTDPANEVIFTLETQHVKCIFSITNKGIRCRIIDPGPTQRPKEYFITEKPFTNISELKKILKEKNLNIFPDSDASFYIENGYYSEKHLATETHTYCCMALHSCFIKFSSSIWNRLAKRRDIILKFLQYEENPSAVVQVHITPEETRFVEVTEICTKGDEVKLAYTPTWRNINFYCDLHNAVISVENYALEKRCRDKQLLYYLKTLLSEIRILSFS